MEKLPPQVASLAHVRAGVRAEVQLARESAPDLDACVADEDAVRASAMVRLVGAKRAVEEELERAGERLKRKRETLRELRSVGDAFRAAAEADAQGSQGGRIATGDNRALRLEVVALRRLVLSFAKEQWPPLSASESQFEGGDFWDAVVAACTAAAAAPAPGEENDSPLPDESGESVVEFSTNERPLAELLLQLGVAEYATSLKTASSAANDEADDAVGGIPTRLRLVPEVFGEDPAHTLG